MERPFPDPRAPTLSQGNLSVARRNLGVSFLTWCRIIASPKDSMSPDSKLHQEWPLLLAEWGLDSHPWEELSKAITLFLNKKTVQSYFSYRVLCLWTIGWEFLPPLFYSFNRMTPQCAFIEQSHENPRGTKTAPTLTPRRSPLLYLYLSSPILRPPSAPLTQIQIIH